MKIVPTALVLLLILTGCAVSPEYRRPPTRLPEQYAEAPPQDAQASPINPAWWKLFNDPLLDELQEKAAARNPDIHEAAARIEEADAVLRQTGAALLPAIDLGAAGKRSRSSTETAVPLPPGAPILQTDYRASLSTAFEVDFWGKLRAASAAARAQVLAARHADATVRLTLAGLVARNYLNLRALDAQLAVVRETLRSRRDSLRLTQDKLRGGVASRIDVAQAESAVAAVVAQLAELRQQRDLAQHQVALLTGTPDLQLGTGDIGDLPLPPAPPLGLPARLLEARPDIRQAEENLIALNARIGVAKAALFPAISLTGLLGGQSMELSNLFASGARIWSLGFALSLPIFDAGRLDAQVDQATAQQKQGVAAYQRAVENAFREVNDALAAARQSAAAEAALTTRREAARQVLELTEERRQAGYSAYPEVLDAQRSLNDAQLAFVQNRQARLAAAVELFRAMGGGWQ
ncbi:MAG: efflux transporter outer membrane subunit [Sulfuricella sp.]|nr:efflux transporter outer membrane subunit [Sulfuricella sp.]